MIAHESAIDAALHHLGARDDQPQPRQLLRALFAPIVEATEPVDAQFIDATRRNVVGVARLPFAAPAVARLLREPEIFLFLESLWRDGRSVLVTRTSPHPSPLPRGDGRGEGLSIHVFLSGPEPTMVPDLPASIASRMAEVLGGIEGWAGALDRQGRHLIDPRSPSPGPHFFTNLLMGNRIGFPRPLQTTPKSVVDHLGRGSFRSHADTQVLAARWDLRAEENGFPANRQFYLAENGHQILYSADPSDPNVEWAQTIHAVNRTTIRYRTRCGLEIGRVIFVLPQEEGLPLATEVQSITVVNRGLEHRRIRLVATGMFGPAQAGALREDVLYTNLTMEGRVFQDSAGGVVAVSPHYHPFWAQEDVRFHSMVVHQDGHTSFPTEFCTSFNEFVGNGTLERPDGLLRLSNRLARKGPGFFALATELSLAPGASARVDNFTGLVSSKTDPTFDESSFEHQLRALLQRYGRGGELDRALEAAVEWLDVYRRHLEIDSGDLPFDRYVNINLPFQILYQTFVSRSFDQTQKGHREIGAREIQDLYASMPFFLASGHQSLVKELLREWAGQVFEFGYVNHNFYWVGKQPGEFSDDGLWLVQALGRYLRQSGDVDFLDEECEVAGTSPLRRRTIYETVEAILRYSGAISTGKHGIPLLDRADWNDTLQLDRDYLDGPHKEAAWRHFRPPSNGNTGSSAGAALRPAPCFDGLDPVGSLSDIPSLSHYSESVMNGFLLKVALDEALNMAEKKKDLAAAARMKCMAARLVDNLQRHAWKGDFFARVLFNKYPDGRHSYLGARGDGLSADPALEGSYFLNSFTWSILSDVATEEQIATMLEVVERVLWTPHGLKLCSPVDFSDIAGRGGSDEYFPGDRENGGVFKHADAMAAAAVFEAARRVEDPKLAEKLAGLGYRVLDVIMPYRAMADPFTLAGNPRFCTQYNNSETGENVGPTLSGTATWLWLALVSAFGLRVTPDTIQVSPILRPDQRSLTLRLRTGRAEYRIAVSKPFGFRRPHQGQPTVSLDGHPLDGNQLPHLSDGRPHNVEVVFSS